MQSLTTPQDEETSKRTIYVPFKKTVDFSYGKINCLECAAIV